MVSFVKISAVTSYFTYWIKCYIQGSVHRDTIYENDQQDATV
jgi:hypothetical protein